MDFVCVFNVFVSVIFVGAELICVRLKHEKSELNSTPQHFHLVLKWCYYHKRVPTLWNILFCKGILKKLVRLGQSALENLQGDKIPISL